MNQNKTNEIEMRIRTERAADYIRRKDFARRCYRDQVKNFAILSAIAMFFVLFVVDIALWKCLVAAGVIAVVVAWAGGDYR